MRFGEVNCANREELVWKKVIDVHGVDWCLMRGNGGEKIGKCYGLFLSLGVVWAPIF